MKKCTLHKWIVIILCLAFICFQGIILKSWKAVAATTGTITATSLNVRSGPGTSYDKVQVNGSNAYLKKGDKISIISEKSGWYKISFTFSGKKAEGYVMDDYVKVSSSAATTPTPKPTAVPTPTVAPSQVNIKTADFKVAGSITATNLNVRKKPTTASTKLASIVKNQKVTVLNEVISGTEKWYRISFKANNTTKTGYVLSNYVKLTLSSSVKASVNSKTKVKLRTGGGDSYKYLTNAKGSTISLSNKKAVTITKEVTDSKGKKWFKVSFTVSSVKYSGYILASQILIKSTASVTPTPTVTPKPTASPTPTPKATATPTPTPVISPSASITPVPTSSGALSDEEFELKLDEEGFPDSYKPYLRELHQLYPTWVFEAYQTGLDWDTVIQKESALGINLISNGKGVEWKSLETGAYNWSTDSFIPFDGSTWVTPSKEALEYYMDPRNFLNDKGIFQFELLIYKSEYQNVTGVEGILYNTPLHNTTYTCQDDSGKDVEYTYSETFIKAAEYSGVSPYHLASRSKQEVVTGTTSLSSSVTGLVSGLEGLYNFYNIGAYNSTVAGGAVANGLKYAKNGTTNQSLNGLYLIPWDNPYASIVGGAYIIGSNYINRGQDTTYLQKFNVTPTSTYSHQYMANIEAPNAEAKKTFAAYSGMTDIPIAFAIPVYDNMPGAASPVPETAYNPNNWLKTLKVDGYSLTPTFDLKKDQTYSLIVNENAKTINVSATAVSKKAGVSGTGKISLKEGNNEVIITVTAEKGDIREYLINVVRESIAR